MESSRGKKDVDESQNLHSKLSRIARMNMKNDEKCRFYAKVDDDVVMTIPKYYDE